MTGKTIKYPENYDEALQLVSQLKQDFGLKGYGFYHREDWDEAFDKELSDEEYERVKKAQWSHDSITGAVNERLEYIAEMLDEDYGILDNN